MNSVFQTAFFVALNAVMFSLIYFSKYSVNLAERFSFCGWAFPQLIYSSSHMCRGYHPSLNFVLAFECAKCSRINNAVVNGSTGRQCLVLKWKLTVWGQIYYFTMWKQGELAGAAVLCCFSEPLSYFHLNESEEESRGLHGVGALSSFVVQM